MVEQNFLTSEEGCNTYLDNCRARKLREGTIKHYRQIYVHFAKFFDMQMPVSEIDEKMYQKNVVYLRETLHNDVIINAYLRDFITTMHFLMNEVYLNRFIGCRLHCWVLILPILKEVLFRLLIFRGTMILFLQ